MFTLVYKFTTTIKVIVLSCPVFGHTKRLWACKNKLRIPLMFCHKTSLGVMELLLLVYDKKTTIPDHSSPGG